MVLGEIALMKTMLKSEVAFAVPEKKCDFCFIFGETVWIRISKLLDDRKQD